jgi:hypothetical protein
MIRLRPLVLVLLAAASFAAATPPPSPTKAPGKSAAAKKTAQAEPVALFDSEADPELTLQHYRDVCKKSNRRCLAFFGTDRCGACRVVADAVYERRFYTELLKQFVPFFVLAEPGTSGGEIAARYGIDPKAPHPAVVIFDPKGNVTEALAKGEMSVVAKKGTEAVQLWLIDRFDRTKPD